MPEETTVRFTIAPPQGGAWLWKTQDRGGRIRASGLAPSRKLAAALVIRDILLARLQQAPREIPRPSAKAA